MGIDIKIDEHTKKQIERIKEYLSEKGIEATDDEIISAAIRIAKRLGAGDWTFALEFRHFNKEKR